MAASTRTRFNLSRQKHSQRGASSVLPLSLIALLALLSAGVFYLYQSSPPKPLQSAGASAISLDSKEATPPAMVEKSDAGLAIKATKETADEVPVASAEELEQENVTEGPLNFATPTECIAAHFSEDTFGKNPDLGFICEVSDVGAAGHRIYAQVARNGRGPGVRSWVFLAEFEWPVIFALSKRCCEEPLMHSKLAIESRACPDINEALDKLQSDWSKDHIENFSDVIQCLSSRRIRMPDHHISVKRDDKLEAVALFRKNWLRISKEQSKEPSK